MGLIGQAVPHGHAGISTKLFHDFLPKTPVLDAVKHPSQHPSCVGNALFFPDLRTGGIEIRRPHTQIMGCHFKGAAGSSAGFFKNQRNIFAPQRIVGHAFFLFGFQLCRQINKPANLLRREIQQFQKVSVFQIHCGVPPVLFLSCHSARRIASSRSAKVSYAGNSG